MYNYNICNQADEEIFIKQCKAIENKIPNITKGELLTDVDGSKIQEYLVGDKKIRIFSSKDVDVVYIESEIDLEQYFK